MFCIQCQTCGWVTFAKWTQYEEGTISESVSRRPNMAKVAIKVLQDFAQEDDSTGDDETGYRAGHEM